MGQLLQPSQNEQSQSVGGFLPGSCSERQAACGKTPQAVLCQHKLNYLHLKHSIIVLCHLHHVPRHMLWKKRRAINFDGASVDESEFKPSQLKEDVQSSREDGSLDREGRFLLYWITTTSISTSTSFTTTFSVYSVSCTPTGGSECG